MADPRELRLRAGLAALARHGVSLEAATVAELERMLAEDPSTALAVAERLGGVVSGESAAALGRMDAGAAQDKLLRREVRRALYRLKQKGVATPPSAASAAVPATPSPLSGPAPEGYLSFSDPFGDRLLWVVKPRAGGGFLQLSTVVNEPAGLREAALAEVSRKGLRALREELRSRHGLRLVEVDWRYCDWVAYEGYERARTRGELSESVAQYPQLRMQLFGAAPLPTTLSIPATPGDPARALASSVALFEEEELARWFLPEAALAPHLARYREIRDSPIVLDRAAQLARVEEIVVAAVEDVFSAPQAPSWQRRLQEMACFFALTSRPEAAARAGAIANAVASGQSARRIPFCEELVRRTFGLFFAREAEREREEKASSVLVTPDDLRAAQARARDAARRRPQ
jgi:hypothetical protein